VKIEFTKMSGAGNDFIVIDNRSGIIKDGAAFAKRVCDRHWSIGADGLLLIEISDKASYRMMYYNADGSYGGMCGNGGRCISQFAYMKHIANSTHTFEALDHIYSVTIESRDISIHMKDPISLKLNQHLMHGMKKILYHSIDTGTQHIVLNIDDFGKNIDIDKFEVHRWGRLLRWHKKFAPAGTNVNFIKIAEGNVINLRTFERGVEAETLACGTGSIASAIIAYRKWKITAPIHVIPTSKVPLLINFSEVEKNIQNVTLTGPASVTFTGSVDA
jgi:diaminopimelate epimerase